MRYKVFSVSQVSGGHRTDHMFMCEFRPCGNLHNSHKPVYCFLRKWYRFCGVEKPDHSPGVTFIRSLKLMPLCHGDQR